MQSQLGHLRERLFPWFLSFYLQVASYRCLLFDHTFFGFSFHYKNDHENQGLNVVTNMSEPANATATSTANNPFHPRDPFLKLSSQCLRTAFGLTVQLVADALQSRGAPCSLQNIMQTIHQHCPPPARRLGLSAASIDASCIQASLLVLIQHEIVTYHATTTAPAGRSVTRSSVKRSIILYDYHPNVARNVLRYARYVDFVRKAVDETAAAALESLLLQGRMATMDWIARVQVPVDHRYTSRQQVMEAMYKLVSQGFVVRVSEVDLDIVEDDQEMEFENDEQQQQPPPSKRVRLQVPDDDEYKGQDPAVVQIYKSNAQYKATLPIDAVWRVNTHLFHETFQAFHFGRFVAEKYGFKVQSCGSLVTAALKFRANATATTLHAAATFTPLDIIKYLPKPVLQILEKKPGGLQLNLTKSLDALADCSHLVRKHSEAAFEIVVTRIRSSLQERAMHQMIHDRHGQVAARIVAILAQHKWLESDIVAEHAMVPAKDVRQWLHQLYKNRYVDLLQLSATATSSSSSSASATRTPAHTIYVWGASNNPRHVAARQVATALYNVRSRQASFRASNQHWMEREKAQETNSAHDDQETYRIFCAGLERLGTAASQLDETFMLLMDYV
jgi:hypothetical protein